MEDAFSPAGETAPEPRHHRRSSSTSSQGSSLCGHGDVTVVPIQALARRYCTRALPLDLQAWRFRDGVRAVPLAQLAAIKAKCVQCANLKTNKNASKRHSEFCPRNLRLKIGATIVPNPNNRGPLVPRYRKHGACPVTVIVTSGPAPKSAGEREKLNAVRREMPKSKRARTNKAKRLFSASSSSWSSSYSSRTTSTSTRTSSTSSFSMGRRGGGGDAGGDDSTVTSSEGGAPLPPQDVVVSWFSVSSRGVLDERANGGNKRARVASSDSGRLSRWDPPPPLDAGRAPQPPPLNTTQHRNVNAEADARLERRATEDSLDPVAPGTRVASMELTESEFVYLQEALTNFDDDGVEDDASLPNVPNASSRPLPRRANSGVSVSNSVTTKDLEDALEEMLTPPSDDDDDDQHPKENQVDDDPAPPPSLAAAPATAPRAADDARAVRFSSTTTITTTTTTTRADEDEDRSQRPPPKKRPSYFVQARSAAGAGLKFADRIASDPQAFLRRPRQSEQFISDDLENGGPGVRRGRSLGRRTESNTMVLLQNSAKNGVPASSRDDETADKTRDKASSRHRGEESKEEARPPASTSKETPAKNNNEASTTAAPSTDDRRGASSFRYKALCCPCLCLAKLFSSSSRKKKNTKGDASQRGESKT